MGQEIDARLERERAEASNINDAITLSSKAGRAALEELIHAKQMKVNGNPVDKKRCLFKRNSSWKYFT